MDCFLRLTPDEIEDTDAAATIGGSEKAGQQVGPGEMERVDLIVSGSVAVTEGGARVGKGEGYSDLEFAILRAFGLVDGGTATVSTVHERQVVDGAVPTGAHDVPIEQVCTPDRRIAAGTDRTKPAGIDWGALSEGKIEEIPILQSLRE